MATCNAELRSLISKAEAAGASVHVSYDMDSMISEGRSVISAVQVSGLKGCGPYPMAAITAAERLRELTA